LSGEVRNKVSPGVTSIRNVVSRSIKIRTPIGMHETVQSHLLFGIRVDLSTSSIARHELHEANDFLHASSNLLDQHRVSLGSLKKILLLIVICSRLEILGKQFSNTVIKGIVAIDGKSINNSISMITRRSSQTLTKELKLEGTSSIKLKSSSASGITKLFVNLVGNPS
jgi:hypothetical protein